MTPDALLGPAQIRDLAGRLGVRPTKTLGQNFVVDGGTVRRIVRLARVRPGERVVEIGPGLGSLTLGLLEAGADVIAVEIDQVLAEALPRTVADRAPDAVDRLTVLAADALSVVDKACAGWRSEQIASRLFFGRAGLLRGCRFRLRPCVHQRGREQPKE